MFAGRAATTLCVAAVVVTAFSGPPEDTRAEWRIPHQEERGRLRLTTTIQLAPDGVAVEGRRVSREELSAHLMAFADAEAGSGLLVITLEPEVAAESLVDLLDLATYSGIRHLSVARARTSVRIDVQPLGDDGAGRR